MCNPNVMADKDKEEKNMIRSVKDVEDLLKGELRNLILNHSYSTLPGCTSSKKQKLYEMMEEINQILGLGFFAPDNYRKDMIWLFSSIEKEKLKLRKAKDRKECDYIHALSIQECVTKSLCDYRVMQREWPEEELMKFEVQAKLASLQEQEGRIKEIIKVINSQMQSMLEREFLLDSLKNYLMDTDYFKKMEEEENG